MTRRLSFLVIAATLVWTPLEASDAAVRAILGEIARSPSLETHVRKLCDEIGPRPSGSEAMRQASAFALQAFRDAGVDEAWTETLQVPLAWSEGETRVELREPVSFAVKAASTAWSPATPAGGIEAEVLDAGNGSFGSVSRLADRARGKILLVKLREASTFHDLGQEQRHAILAMREASELGAAAVVFASTRPHRVLYRHIHSVNAELDPLPSAVLAREDALRISRLTGAGHKAILRLDLPNQTGGPVEDVNVVAEVRGAGKPQEMVILGAHLDSWDLGPGCLDNAVNVALVLESARAIAAQERRPRRSVRFVLFSGEEQGLFGSQAYVRQHEDELDRISAVLIHDMGLGKIEGYSLAGRMELEAGLAQAMRPLESRGPFRHPSEAFFGSDHFDFLIQGVPALVAMQDTADYILPYHSELDTYDKVSLAHLRERTGVAAITAYGIADLPGRLGPRLSRGEIEKLMRVTRMDDQLQFLGLWESWEKGERGRALTVPAGP